MVNICDKKRHLMLFILPYFHDKLIPIMTPVTFGHFWLMSYKEMRVSAYKRALIDEVDFFMYQLWVNTY